MNGNGMNGQSQLHLVDANGPLPSPSVATTSVRPAKAPKVTTNASRVEELLEMAPQGLAIGTLARLLRIRRQHLKAVVFSLVRAEKVLVVNGLVYPVRG